MFQGFTIRIGDLVRSKSARAALRQISLTAPPFPVDNTPRAAPFSDYHKPCHVTLKLREQSKARRLGFVTKSVSTSAGLAPVPLNAKKSGLPLEDLKVLDLSRVLAGPFATQILSDLGADVLKIEQPGVGDETRQWRTSGETGQMWKPENELISLYFCAVNRNKRSCTLDLKSSQGREIVKKLVRSRSDGGSGYDVVVSNFLPGRLDKLGLGFDELRKVNPGVILAEVSGYGAKGPWSQRSGYDAVALAEAGLLHITGEPNGPPIKPGVAIGDLCTGLYVHGAILAAVCGRTSNGGIGCRIEGSLFESAVSLLINVGLASLNLDLDKEPPQRRRGKRFSCGHPNLVPYNRYQTKDKKWLFVAANNNTQWKRFCERLRLTDICEMYQTNDSRVENRQEIDRVLGRRFSEHDMQVWLDTFKESGLPYGPINDVVDALEHPQAVARNMVVELEDYEAARDGILRLIGPAIKLAGVESIVRRKPPLLGQHTNEVLSEVGYGPEDIQQLLKAGIV